MFNNLLRTAAFALLLPAFVPALSANNGPEKKPTEAVSTNAEKITADPTAKKILVLEITSKTGHEVQFSAFIRHGEDNYFVEKETTPYRLELEDAEFSGVFHKLSSGQEWEVKAEKFLGEQRLTDVKAAHDVTVVESSGNTISSWKM